MCLQNFYAHIFCVFDVMVMMSCIILVMKLNRMNFDMVWRINVLVAAMHFTFFLSFLQRLNLLNMNLTMLERNKQVFL